MFTIFQHDSAHTFAIDETDSLFEATCVYYDAIAYGPTFDDDDDEGIELFSDDGTILWHSFS